MMMCLTTIKLTKVHEDLESAWHHHEKWICVYHWVNRHAPDWSTDVLTSACCNLRSIALPMRSLRDISPTILFALSTTIRCLSPSVRNITNVRWREYFSRTHGAEWLTNGSCTRKKMQLKQIHSYYSTVWGRSYAVAVKYIYKVYTQCHTIAGKTIQNNNRHWRRPTQVWKHLWVALKHKHKTLKTRIQNVQGIVF